MFQRLYNCLALVTAVDMGCVTMLVTATVTRGGEGRHVTRQVWVAVKTVDLPHTQTCL